MGSVRVQLANMRLFEQAASVQGSVYGACFV